MAPTKRTSGTVKAAPAKKAKVIAPEQPVLDFIHKCDEIPKACREMLQAAVPLCLEVTESERHKYQTEVLGHVDQLIAGVEHKKREAVSAAEAELASIEAERAREAADAAVKKNAADSKKAECDEKGKVVDGLREIANGAKEVLDMANKAEAEFGAKKAAMLSEQETFGKLMTDVFQPLKEGSLPAKMNSKKGKLIGELKKKLGDLGAQDSMAEALAQTLKMTPEKRAGTFAQTTVKFAQEYFDKHSATLAQDIAKLDSEATTYTSAIAAAEATYGEKKAALDVVAKEWDEMQDVWVALEGESGQAARVVSSIEARTPKATKVLNKAQADLDKFLQLPALLASLKEKSTKVVDEPEEAVENTAEGEHAEEHAAEGQTADAEMQAEA